MLLNRGALTWVQCIKVFGGESEIAASNMPRNILKILACTCKRKKKNKYTVTHMFEDQTTAG